MRGAQCSYYMMPLESLRSLNKTFAITVHVGGRATFGGQNTSAVVQPALKEVVAHYV